MTRHCIILLLFSLLCFNALGQDRTSLPQKRTLIGVVKDEAGKGLPGAVVYVKDHETIGTETDKYGNFSLQNIPEGNQTIIFSMLGMEEVQIAYTGQESTVVTLKEEAATLNDGGDRYHHKAQEQFHWIGINLFRTRAENNRQLEYSPEPQDFGAIHEHCGE